LCRAEGLRRGRLRWRTPCCAPARPRPTPASAPRAPAGRCP
jgi:hypothetical protein